MPRAMPPRAKPRAVTQAMPRAIPPATTHPSNFPETLAPFPIRTLPLPVDWMIAGFLTRIVSGERRRNLVGSGAPVPRCRVRLLLPPTLLVLWPTSTRVRRRCPGVSRCCSSDEPAWGGRISKPPSEWGEESRSSTGRWVGGSGGKGDASFFKTYHTTRLHATPRV